MKLKDKTIDISRWDSYSIIVLLVALMFQAFKWRVFPIFLDVYYHLLTTVGFNEAGGWVHSCFWEFAPIGRPQLYPPLLHIIMLMFLKAGIPIIVIGKLFQFIIYPLLIFVIWYVIREIFDKKLAFFVLFLLFSIYSFYLVAINTQAASLSLILCLLSLLFLERDKILTASILLAAAFYAHGFTPWLFMGIFMLYGLFYRKRFIFCLKVCLLSLFLASPLLIYQFNYRQFYDFQRNIGENLYIELNISHWVILLFGLFSCLAKKNRYYIFVSLFLVSFVFLFTDYIFRYLSFYGIMSLVFMNAVSLSSLYDKLNKKYRKAYLTSILMLFFILGPTLNLDLSKKYTINDHFVYSFKVKNFVFKRGFFNLNILDSSLVNFVFYGYGVIRTNELSIYFPKYFSETAEVIMKNSNDKDIIYSNFPYTCGVLSLLSHRAASTAMLSEVKPYSPFDKILVSKLIIWQKNPDNMKEEPIYLIERYHLNKIADTKLAFIYENPKCSSKKQTLSAAIGYKILFVLIFLVLVFAVWSAKFRSFPESEAEF